MMIDTTNQTYTQITSNILGQLDRKQESYLRNFYYEEYLKNSFEIVDSEKFSFEEFYKQVDSSTIKIIQQHCLSCRKFKVIFTDKTDNFIYCTNCGRKSLFDFGLESIERIKRIMNVHNISNLYMQKKFKEVDDYNKKIFSFETVQLELVALNSLLETLAREYYMNIILLELVYIKKSSVIDIIGSAIKNDFQNIDKIVERFKMDLKIDLSKSMLKKDRDNLRHLVDLRNIFAHNNGYADPRFLKKPISKILKEENNLIGDKFVFTNRNHMKAYFESVINLLGILEESQNTRFSQQILSLIIANSLND